MANYLTYDDALSLFEKIGEVLPQKATLPTAAQSLLGKIYQYTGATSNGLVNGRFYKCVGNGDPVVYNWVEIKISDEKVWVGTRAEATAAKAAGTYPSNGLAIISDESDDPIAGEIEEEDVPRWRKPQYVNGVKIVSFEDGTIPELQDMITAHKAGTINIYDYWHIGDHRRIRIDEIIGTVMADSETGETTEISPNQPAHYTDAIIADISYPSDSNVIFLIKIGYGLPIGMRYKNSDMILEGYNSSEVKIYLNNSVYPKIESDFRSLLSNFTVETVINDVVTTSTEKIIIPSYTEFGLTTFSTYGANKLPIEGTNKVIAILSNVGFLDYSTCFTLNNNNNDIVLSQLAGNDRYWTRSTKTLTSNSVNYSQQAYTAYRVNGSSAYANPYSITSKGAILPFCAIC